MLYDKFFIADDNSSSPIEKTVEVYIPEKSIAVLPFKNLSANNENGAFFRSDYLLGDTMLDSLRDDPTFKGLIGKKLEEEAKVTEVFRRKLKEYQDRGELLWLTED